LDEKQGKVRCKIVLLGQNVSDLNSQQKSKIKIQNKGEGSHRYMVSYISYLLIRGILIIFRWIPFWVIYRLSDVLRPLLQYVFHYRKKVIQSQIRSCFPHKTEQERSQIVTQFYQNLSDVLLESIKGLAVKPALIQARVDYKDSHIITNYLAAGQSVIMTGSHHCNWEWAAITVASCVDGRVVGVYKRLSNKYLEQFVKRQRAALGMTLLEMKGTLQAVKTSKTPAAYVLMADQWPSNRQRAHWVTFMGRETACLPGVDFISREEGFPVIYYTMQRKERGRYQITFEELVGAHAGLPEEGVTQLNQAKIAQQVIDDPANWLWSHKRWKQPREAP
jgi:Kdo2-lipid IVA lauroyltransferase/acyltransferase